MFKHPYGQQNNRSMFNEFDDIAVDPILSYRTGAVPVGNEGRNTGTVIPGKATCLISGLISGSPPIFL
jgi:hypothetical protein